MFKRLGKRGEEDTGKPIPTLFEILTILAIVVAVVYMLLRLKNGFLPK